MVFATAFGLLRHRMTKVRASRQSLTLAIGADSSLFVILGQAGAQRRRDPGIHAGAFRSCEAVGEGRRFRKAGQVIFVRAGTHVELLSE
jgi:hypothetical protein